jgi:hypothetical protein
MKVSENRKVLNVQGFPKAIGIPNLAYILWPKVFTHDWQKKCCVILETTEMTNTFWGEEKRSEI